MEAKGNTVFKRVELSHCCNDSSHVGTCLLATTRRLNYLTPLTSLICDNLSVSSYEVVKLPKKMEFSILKTAK